VRACAWASRTTGMMDDGWLTHFDTGGDKRGDSYTISQEAPRRGKVYWKLEEHRFDQHGVWPRRKAPVAINRST